MIVGFCARGRAGAGGGGGAAKPLRPPEPSGADCDPASLTSQGGGVFFYENIFEIHQKTFKICSKN